MAFLVWLKETGIAHYIQEDPWGYPIVLSAHAIGMGLLAGVVLMIDFRVLGFGRTVPLHYMRRMLRVAWVGLLLNVISGLMLFAADAVSHFENTAFRVKITLLLVGGALMVLLARRVFDEDVSDDVIAQSVATRVIAAVSACVWIGVIIAGRLIAYDK